MLYLDRSTGAVTGRAPSGWRAFFAKVQDVHRWLAFSEKRRAAGKAITGAANILFFGLALSGLYIWWPRLRGIRRVSSVGLFQRGLSGKARDFNWHNVIGVWSALPLLVITVTGMVMSYRWAGDLVYRAFGDAPPPAPNAGGTTGRGKPGHARLALSRRRRRLARPVSGASPSYESPGWRAITLRAPGGAARARSRSRSRRGRFLNRFARSSLTLDAKSGAVVKWEPYAEAAAGRQARSWMRFLHTGEALGVHRPDRRGRSRPSAAPARRDRDRSLPPTSPGLARAGAAARSPGPGGAAKSNSQPVKGAISMTPGTRDARSSRRSGRAPSGWRRERWWPMPP